MTTIQSLLQPLNLKKLVPALTRLRQADPQPFYLLKLRTAPIPPALSRTSLALKYPSPHPVAVSATPASSSTPETSRFGVPTTCSDSSKLGPPAFRSG